MLVEKFSVESPHTRVTEEAIETRYTYQHNELELGADGAWVVRPKETTYEFKTSTKVPKLG